MSNVSMSKFISFLEIFEDQNWNDRNVIKLTLKNTNIEYIITQNFNLYLACKKCQKEYKQFIVDKNKDLKKLIKSANKHFLLFYENKTKYLCPDCGKYLEVKPLEVDKSQHISKPETRIDKNQEEK